MTREQEQVFDKVVFGGYDVEQVDDYRTETEIAFRAVQKENAVLVQKLRILAAKVEELQEKEAPSAQAAQVLPVAEEAIPVAVSAETEKKQQALEAKLNETLGELEHARQALAEESAKTAAAEEALAKRKTEELAFCRELMEKYAARQKSLTEEAPIIEEAPETSPLFASEAAVPVAEAVAEPAAPVTAEKPAEAAFAARDTAETIAFTAIPKAKTAERPLSAEEACPKPAEPMSESDRQTYEECLARILREEAKEAQLKHGESRLVSLRPASTPLQKESDSAGKSRVSAAPKKKKEGFFDFVKESVRKALSDDDDDEDDFPAAENEPLQFGRAYDVKKRK